MMQGPTRNSSAARPSRSGFTLIESLIAVSLMGVLFLAVAQTSSRASDAFDEGNAEHMLSTSTHRCIERVANAIRFADGTLLAPELESPLGASEVAFRTPVGFNGTEVQWSSVRITVELEPGELDDGIDNDKDGLIDEQLVVLTDNIGQPDERRLVLASSVARLFEGETLNNADDNGNGLTDETGLSFSSEGNVVTVRLTCQRRDDSGRLLTKTAITAVRLRNTGG
jgi:prepilin-type N-terminal cleavage/methylation domain-containing protein